MMTVTPSIGRESSKPITLPEMLRTLSCAMRSINAAGIKNNSEEKTNAFIHFVLEMKRCVVCEPFGTTPGDFVAVNRRLLHTYRLLFRMFFKKCNQKQTDCFGL